jgi:hypothetical protein
MCATAFANFGATGQLARSQSVPPFITRIPHTVGEAGGAVLFVSIVRSEGMS